MTSDRPTNQRRSPKQARSRATWEAIVEAASQILERGGSKALNTNTVAERAGVSIGTLYQYFPDKQAILLAAAKREFGSGATPLLGRQGAFIQALIELVEAFGPLGEGAGARMAKMSASNVATTGARRVRGGSARKDRCVDFVQRRLIGLIEPALVPIQIKARRI